MLHKHLPCVLVLGLAFASAQAQLTAVQTMDLKEFSLTYALVMSSAGTDRSEGEYKITQSNGKIFVQSTGKDASFWFLFDGKRSFYKYDPKGIMCEKGFGPGLMSLPIYLPFNTPTWRQYYPISCVKAYAARMKSSPNSSPGLQQLASRLIGSNEANSAVLSTGTEADGVFMPGVFTKEPGHSRLEIRMPGQPPAKVYDFSDFRPLGLGSVPGKVLVTFRAGGESPTSGVRSVTIKATLTELTTRMKKIPLIESLVPPGCLVSYQESGVAKAGVVYDPHDGTLGDQIEEQVRRRRHPDLTPATASSSAKRTPLVPLILCLAFAVVAIVLLALQRRRPK